MHARHASAHVQWGATIRPYCLGTRYIAENQSMEAVQFTLQRSGCVPSCALKPFVHTHIHIHTHTHTQKAAARNLRVRHTANRGPLHRMMACKRTQTQTRRHTTMPACQQYNITKQFVAFHCHVPGSHNEAHAHTILHTRTHTTRSRGVLQQP
jgi:hypothetical protein